VGLRRFGGVLAGGMTSWREARMATDRIERLTVQELHERASDGIQILDVREQSEWEQRHIPGSIHRPYHDLDRVPDGLDADRPIAVICSSGQRSGLAASLLQRFGADGVVHVVDGGVGTWAEAGWPIQ
jgi:hydroxyacylglutathione hydrolase